MLWNTFSEKKRAERAQRNNSNVLILIVMEYLLRVKVQTCCQNVLQTSLNPYCYGIPSQRCKLLDALFYLSIVLILIVMEYLLRVEQSHYWVLTQKSLNPYCYGIPSQRLWTIFFLLSMTIRLNPYCYGIPSQRSGFSYVYNNILLS